LSLPRWLDNTVSLLGSLSIPMMLLTLGVSLGSIRPRQIGRGFALGGLRMLCGAAIGWAVAVMLGLPPLAQAVLVMQAAMPVAVFNYLFAVRAGRSPETVASLVICSTVLSFRLIPLLLAWWLPASGQGWACGRASDTAQVLRPASGHTAAFSHGRMLMIRSKLLKNLAIASAMGMAAATQLHAATTDEAMRQLEAIIADDQRRQASYDAGHERIRFCGYCHGEDGNSTRD